jgi:hypothetical protein
MTFPESIISAAISQSDRLWRPHAVSPLPRPMPYFDIFRSYRFAFLYCFDAPLRRFAREFIIDRH